MEKTCKLVVLGDSGVGKTTIIHKYVYDEYRVDFKATIGADFSSKSIQISENETLDLNIWDTAGEERFHSIGAMFYRGVEAVIFVYDITQLESFKHIVKWKDDLYAKSGITNEDNIPMIVFGNKVDLEDQRQVTKDEIQVMKQEYGLEVIEVSSKTGQGVEEGFKKIVDMIMSAHKEMKNISSYTNLTLTENNNNKSCC